MCLKWFQHCKIIQRHLIPTLLSAVWDCDSFGYNFHDILRILAVLKLIYLGIFQNITWRLEEFRKKTGFPVVCRCLGSGELRVKSVGLVSTGCQPDITGLHNGDFTTVRMGCSAQGILSPGKRKLQIVKWLNGSQVSLPNLWGLCQVLKITFMSCGWLYKVSACPLLRRETNRGWVVPETSARWRGRQTNQSFPFSWPTAWARFHPWRTMLLGRAGPQTNSP